MKLPKTIKCLVLVLFALSFAAASQSQTADENSPEVKGAGEKSTIAIMDFSASNAPTGEAVVLSGFVRSAVVRCGKFRVVDKKNMENILAEQAFQQTGCTSSECAVKLGKILNVNRMVVGEYAVMGGVKFLTGSLVDVESGEIIRTGKVKGFEVGDADQAADKLVEQLTVGLAVTAGIESGTQSAVIDPIHRKRFGIGAGFMVRPFKESVWLRAPGAMDYRQDSQSNSGHGVVSASYRAPFRDGMKWGGGIDIWAGYGPTLSKKGNNDLYLKEILGLSGGVGLLVYRSFGSLMTAYVGLGGGIVRRGGNAEYGRQDNTFSGSIDVDSAGAQTAMLGLEFFITSHFAVEMEFQYNRIPAWEYPAGEPNSIGLKYDPISFSLVDRYYF